MSQLVHQFRRMPPLTPAYIGRLKNELRTKKA